MKFEYKIVKNRRMSQSILEERLNILGEDGWDLVSITSYDMGAALMFILKRISDE